DERERAATEQQERAVRRAYVRALGRRLAIAAALAVPTMALSMADLAFPALMEAAWRPYVLFALASPVQLWAALPFYRGALSAAGCGRGRADRKAGSRRRRGRPAGRDRRDRRTHRRGIVGGRRVDGDGRVAAGREARRRRRHGRDAESQRRLPVPCDAGRRRH